MIRFLTAFTFEIDNPQIASAEIMEQLEAGHSLLKNSAGFLFCSREFIPAGVMEAVSRALPFEVIGCTTHGVAVPGAMGEIMLAVAVLTSDESSFRVGLSDPLDADQENRIGELYGRLSGGGLRSLPSLMFLCYPSSVGFTGDRVAGVLHRLSGGRPLFGTNALDETIGDPLPLVFHNGTAYPDRMALLLLYGPAESRFYVDPLPEMAIYSRPVTVTEARGNRIISINNRPALEFVENLVSVSGDKMNAVYGFPLLVDNHDGAGPNPCGIYRVEEGGVLCCGKVINIGAAVKVISQVQERVLRSSAEFAELIKKENHGKNHLIFSCFGRSTPLVDLKDEMELFQKHMRGTPYMFIYSRGEFCPVYEKSGGIRDCFHQFSLVSASF
jgi:hypothetical protein